MRASGPNTLRGEAYGGVVEGSQVGALAPVSEVEPGSRSADSPASGGQAEAGRGARRMDQRVGPPPGRVSSCWVVKPKYS